MRSSRRSAPDVFPPVDRRAARRRKRVRIVLMSLLVLFVVIAAAGIWAWSRLTASLAQLDGSERVPGLRAEVRIERDALGVPTITASERSDALYALGFLHAQERFFQMDLLRRSAAGELAALFGSALVEIDRDVRVHRFRNVARRVLSTMPERDYAEVYARGVNAGLDALGAAPFEYLLIRSAPEPWRPEDSILTVLAMYIDLQPARASRESAAGVLHDILPQPLAQFLNTRGTEWDAPVVGEVHATPAIPPADVYDFRQSCLDGVRTLAQRLPVRAAARARETPSRAHPLFASFGDTPQVSGSNNWAVAGSHTASGQALLAGDMHLGLAVPNIWYRAALVYDDPQTGESLRVTGVSLPGAPAIVVGSNGHVAWTFTNSNSDASDLVVLEMLDAERYRTPDGVRRLELQHEVVHVKGATDDTLEVLETIWGPIIDRDHASRRRAMRWVAHDGDAVNFRLVHMDAVRNLEDAMDVANATAIPAQNCVVVDRSGRIGWTIMGRLPRRVGFDGRVPKSWADGSRRWDGYRTPSEYPRIVDPPEGRIWTANARVVDGDMLDVVGDAGYVMGARAQQIRDRLFEVEAATPGDMLQLQLDDRALLLERWRELLLRALSDDVSPQASTRAALRSHVEDWGGRAAVESVGYRIVRNFRSNLIDAVLGFVLSECRNADPRLRHWHLRNREGPVWKIIRERPRHFLDPAYDSWDEQILAAIDSTLAQLLEVGPTLARRTWGERNTTRIRHPVSLAVPALGRWLDMPRAPLPGDGNMPRVQSPTHGASQRMVVSPGHESAGFFHMPCGQSGHPLSPHYSDGHVAWEEGRPTSFLPGATAHTLRLAPAGS